MSYTPSFSLPNPDARRFGQFLTYLTPCLFAFALAYGVLAAIWWDLATATSCAIILTYSIGLLVARHKVAQGNLTRAVQISALGLLCSSQLLTFCQPALWANFALVPILVAAMVLPYRQGTNLRSLLILCWIALVVTLVLGSVLEAGLPPPSGLLVGLRASTLASTSAFILLLLWQFQYRLNETLQATQAANEQLTDAHAALQDQKTALQKALREVEQRAATQALLLEENALQRAAIMSLSVPVLPVRTGTLVVPLIGALDTERLAALQEQVLKAIEGAHAQQVVLDITGVPLVDTQVAQGLIRTVVAAKLLGASVMLVGTRPEVAQTIVGLGVELPIRTARDLASALR